MGAILNIVIGTVFVFVVFSLVVSGVHELIAAVFAVKSKVLWQTIAGLSAPTSEKLPRLDLNRMLQLPFTAKWVQKLPIIGERAKKWTDPRPVVPEKTPTVVGDFRDGLLARSVRFDSVKTGKPTRIKRLSPQVVSQVLLELGGDLPAFVGEVESVAQQGEAYLQKILDHPSVKGTHLEAPIRAAIARAQGDIDTFRTAIEGWFDARMGSLSGLYRTWARWIMFGVALVVAFVVNVNPIRTIDALRKDTALAQTTADEAASFVATVNPTGDVCDIVGTATSAPPETPSTTTGVERVSNCYTAVQNAIARGRQLPPPLNFDRHLLFRGRQGWLAYFFGCLMGAIAISFGAPFWYDALRKLVSFRS